MSEMSMKRTKIDELLSADSVNMVDPEVSNIDTSLTNQVNSSTSTGQAVNVLHPSEESVTALTQLQLEEQMKQDQLHQQQLQQLQQQQQALMAQAGGDPTMLNQNIQIHQFLPADTELVKPSKGRKFQPVQDEDGVKKCSRCRVKRFNESIDQLEKYQTCYNCRTKRKVVKNPIDTSEPNTYLNYNDFISKIKMNSSMDILEHRFKGYTDERIFKRYDINESIDPSVYQEVGKNIISVYITPLMDETGFRFPVRDYHKGGSKNKKLTFMFICSQDFDKQRKSKTAPGKTSNNKLKTEHCDSKITLSYSLIDGLVQIMYHHKSHAPYKWKKHGTMKGLSLDLSDSTGSPTNSTGSQNSDHMHAVQMQELRHAQLLQHSLPQHPHHNNPANIQLPPLQSIPSDSLPLQNTNSANLQDHRDLLTEVQNLQSYNTTANSTTTNNGTTSNNTVTNVMDGLNGSYTHHHHHQQHSEQQYQYNLRHDSASHQNSVIAAAVAAATAQGGDVNGTDGLVTAGSMNAEIGGDDNPQMDVDLSGVVDKVGDENIDKELIGLTGN